MKVLFFATNSFPYGHGEPLIVSQIETLSKVFDTIVIISSSRELRTYDVPKNVICQNIEVTLTPFEKICGLRNFFSKEVRREIRNIKSNYSVKFSFSILKVILNSYSIGKKYKKFFTQTIIDEKYENFELYFHSYWCTEAVIGYSLIRKTYPQSKMYSRFHAYDLYFERHEPNYLPFRRLIIKNLDKLFFISDQGKEYFLRLFKGAVDENKLIVNRLGVKSLFSNKQVLLQSVPNFLRIISCSSIIKLKRIDLIIEALSLVDELNIEWIHFGDGPLLNELKELAQIKLSPKANIKFSFFGVIDNPTLHKYYSENHVDLFVNTSKYEGVPISIMEAMAYKIPCIGTNTGGVSEIINPSNGFLLPIDFNPTELKDIFVNYASSSEGNKMTLQDNAFSSWNTLYDGEKNLTALIGELVVQNKMCSRCLYDINDFPQIQFDKDGVCEICHIYEDLQKKTVFKDAIGKQKLNDLIFKIKRDGKGKQYDCIVGVSGGVDSSYLAFLSKEWGLRPLILHVDNGWNSELATKNIENILKVLDYNLYTHVIDWEQMRDLQLAFFKASVVDMDLPFDNAFLAILYQIAIKYKIKYILSGHNTVTEGWMPSNFTHYKLDTLNIKAIHKRFRSIKMKGFPLISPIKIWLYKKVHKIKFISPLDFIEYNKNEVKSKLIEELNWRDYGGKHYENLFTKFYQGYILPEKFKIDKRKAHLSTLICSNQITKEEALIEIQKSPYLSDELPVDKEFFIKKMELTEESFNEIMKKPIILHTEYSSYINIIRRLQKIKKSIYPQKR